MNVCIRLEYVNTHICERKSGTNRVGNPPDRCTTYKFVKAKNNNTHAYTLTLTLAYIIIAIK